MFAKKLLVILVFALLISCLNAMAEAPATHPKTGAPLVCDCPKGTPKIDGNLSDWNLNAIKPAILDVKEQIFTGSETWTAASDCSGNFYLMWDDKNIYVGAVIKDDKIVTNKDAGNIWNQDAVEVFFTLPKAAATTGTEHYQYGLTAKNQKWNWCNMENVGNKEPDNVQVASTISGGGYTIEAAIAYNNLKSLSFKAGDVLGFHAVLDDTDLADRELQMTWTGREAHNQTLGYGQFTLASASTVTAVDSNGKATLTWGEIKAK
jgi:hypothetical protein